MCYFEKALSSLAQIKKNFQIRLPTAMGADSSNTAIKFFSLLDVSFHKVNINLFLIYYMDSG